ncbi:MAG: hydroxymethylbilane synthase [Negativicutes bacterium]|nr:hydroxymethylbilane synthase [Negativicutes bacterium]
MWQAKHIADRLIKAHDGLEVEIRHIITTGDKILDVPLAKIGGKGLFTKELENAMLAGEIDLAVHSLKDMPTELPPGLILAAVTERIDPGDALISPRFGTIDKLPCGAKIGTSSLRRKAQLLHYRPDLTAVDLRGNIDTRLQKLETEGLDGILLAVSGLKRLGWQDRITQIVPMEICLPAVGQGALAIEARENDVSVLKLLACLEHQATRFAVTAERAFLHEVEGGCQVPIGVYAAMAGDALELEAAIATPDGARLIREKVAGPPSAAAELGINLARRMIAAGGREILKCMMGGGTPFV